MVSCRLAAQSRIRQAAFCASKAEPGQAATLRFGGRLRRLPCGARSHGLVANSLRELRSLRSDSRDEVRARGALRALAMEPPLLGASEAHRVLPGPGFAAALVGFGAKTTEATTSRQAAPGRGDFCDDEERSAGVGARSALRDLTRRYCLNVAPAKARSELSARPRGEHRSAVGPQGRPPQHERLAGAAWRDALNSRRGGCCLRPLCAATCRSSPGVEETTRRPKHARRRPRRRSRAGGTSPAPPPAPPARRPPASRRWSAGR